MACDDQVAGRVRRAMAKYPAVVEHRMFGGLAFMLGGHMCCGVIGDELMVRVGPEAYAAGFASGRELAVRVARGASFAAALPAKAKRRRKPGGRK